MPFISLVTDPGNLFSNETGIYVTGTNGRRGDCDNLIRNVNQDWERPVNIEFYEPNGELAFNQGAGIKIFGGCSRTRFPQKSFALYARSIYGKGSFQYQLFPEKEINDFEAFLLRSSADDQVGTFLRDPLTQEVVTEYMDMDYQAFRPTVVFINGEYWGIHNLREKINEHYFVDNFGVDTDDLNILTGNAWEVYGNNNSYNDMINFVRYNDMVDDDNYSYIQTQIDVEQFIEYELANIYLGEVDWPGNNIKFWNADDEKHSKWRWINYDRDQCFQYWRLDVNTLALATEPNGTGWPNPQWSTLLLRSLLENDGFKNQFIQLYAYHLSTTFQSERLIHHIDSFAAMMAPEIPRHSERWGGQKDPDSQETWQKPTFENFELWESNVDTMRIFSLERPPIAIQHLIDQFSLDTTDNLSINKNLAEGGLIKLYNRTIPGNNYNGNYFSGVPIKLTATPSYGYSFSHWIATTASGSETLTTQEIEITLNGDMQLTAHFEAYNLEGPLVIINEINYNSSPDFNPGDWIELYNRHTETVDLSGWYLKDSDDSNSFFFPDGFTLEANNYIVICENTTDFDNLYTDVTNRIGNLGFKLSNGGEVIRLYAHDNILVDSVNYGDSTPWPVLADGSGPTLELKDTGLDNDMPENWAAYEFINGTPGKTNSIPESSDKILFTDNNILYQNYPNPFSGTTIIPYSLSERGFVQITVYDMMGKQIKSLVNQNQEAGTYKTEFNTGDLSNGIFIYTMHINHSPVKTRRMVVSE
ncbi:MAG: CotH kinase family protein [Mariniphaga sp.]|nr:CotH kinase family protein [Mariniphaga sp.]